MQKDNTVSVIIAAYNAENFLHRAIESIVQQSLLPNEIIIVNDASQDKTSEIAKSFNIDNIAINVIDIEINAGPGNARNVGIENANTHWVVILDADDVFLSDHIEKLLSLASKNNANLVAPNFCFFDITSNERLTAGLVESDSSFLISKYDFIAKARPLNSEADYGLLKPMFNKEWLMSKSLKYPIDIRHGEDFQFVMDIMLEGAKFYIHKHVTYLYTIRSAGISKTPVDYSAMAKRTLTLLQDNRVKNDSQMKKLIHERANAIIENNVKQNIRFYLKRKNYLTLIKKFICEYKYIVTVVKAVTKNIRS